jgi:hypothetical protein
MKKFALFAMLLCSGMLFGCTKPKETPKEKPAATEGEKKTTESTTTSTELPPAGGGETK